jgi:TDG/mug DNA glycosylase family protein
MIHDSLTKNMTLAFIGFNPSLTSFSTGFHYAHRSNRFYRILHASGLTPVLHSPAESVHFPEWYDYGFTNIVSRPTRRADELTREDYASGRLRLREKLEYFKPHFACFVGKGVYQQYAQTTRVAFGFCVPPKVEGVREFVAPGTSGLVRMALAEQVAIYAELARAIAEYRATARASEGD